MLTPAEQADLLSLAKGLNYAGESITYDTDDGRLRVVVSVHHDEVSSINDYDGDGKVSRYYDYHESHAPRPDTFTGRARKIQVDRSGFVWWEPPAEYWDSLTPAEQRTYQSRIRDLLEYGFVGLVVSIQEPCDHHEYHEVSSASLWSIDYVAADIILDLLAEAEDITDA